MGTITSLEFDNILNHKFDHPTCDYLFYNVEKDRLLEIKNKLQNRTILNFADIAVAFNDDDLNSVEKIITSTDNLAAKNIILSTYLSTLICKELFNYQTNHKEPCYNFFTKENVSLNERLINCKDLNEYVDAREYCRTFDSHDVRSFIKDHNENFILHFFITKNMKNIALQREMNQYVGQYSSSLHSRIYTEDKRLISYCQVNNQPIQYSHDYFDFSVIDESPVLKK